MSTTVEKVCNKLSKKNNKPISIKIRIQNILTSEENRRLVEAFKNTSRIVKKLEIDGFSSVVETAQKNPEIYTEILNGLLEIFASKACQHIEDFMISGVCKDEQQLYTGIQFPKLTKFRLEDSDVSEESEEILRENLKKCQQLQEFSSTNTLIFRALTNILSNVDTVSLKKLKFAISDSYENAYTLMDDFENDELDTEDLGQIILHDNFKNITTLDLKDAYIGKNIIFLLPFFSSSSNLENLNLAGNDLEEEGLLKVINELQWSKLKKLDISSNFRMRDASSTKVMIKLGIVLASSNCNLEQLRLAAMHIQIKEFEILGICFCHPQSKLKNLDLSCNYPFDKNDAKTLLKILSNEHFPLETLTLGDKISYECVEILVSTLIPQTNSKLRNLRISYEDDLFVDKTIFEVILEHLSKYPMTSLRTLNVHQRIIRNPREDLMQKDRQDQEKIELFFKKLKAEDLRKSRIAFLMGIHKRLGEQSAILQASKNEIFDKNLISDIFEMAGMNSNQKIDLFNFYSDSDSEDDSENEDDGHSEPEDDEMGDSSFRSDSSSSSSSNPSSSSNQQKNTGTTSQVSQTTRLKKSEEEKYMQNVSSTSSTSSSSSLSVNNNQSNIDAHSETKEDVVMQREPQVQQAQQLQQPPQAPLANPVMFAALGKRAEAPKIESDDGRSEPESKRQRKS